MAGHDDGDQRGTSVPKCIKTSQEILAFLELVVIPRFLFHDRTVGVQLTFMLLVSNLASERNYANKLGK